MGNEDFLEIIKSKNVDLLMCLIFVISYKPKELLFNDDELKRKEICENNIIIGIKLLEILVNTEIVNTEISKLKKIVKDINPAEIKEENSIIEKSVRFFYCIIQIKEYLWKYSKELLTPITTLIQKEIQFIESFKKENNDKLLNEPLQVSIFRLGNEIDLIKFLNENLYIMLYNESNDEKITEISQILKDLNNNIIDTLDKSNNINILKNLTIHLHKNLDFLLDNQKFIPNCADKDIIRLKYNTFQSNLIEKSIVSLINLFRKNPYEESLTIEIIKTFISISKRKSELYNLFVKSGCIRLLYNVMDNNSLINTVLLSLNLIKMIINSSQENLEMVSKQSKI